MYCRNTAKNKPFSLHKLFSKHLIGVKKKNTGTAPFLDSKKHFESKCLYIPVYLPTICISIRRLTVWPSQDVLQFFILIEISGNSSIFEHFNTSTYNIKTLNFRLQGSDYGKEFSQKVTFTQCKII